MKTKIAFFIKEEHDVSTNMPQWVIYKKAKKIEPLQIFNTYSAAKAAFRPYKAWMKEHNAQQP